MGNEGVTKFTWVIKNFTHWLSNFIDSDQFVAGGCKWSLRAYPKLLTKTKVKFLCLYLVVTDRSSMPSRWRRHIKCRLTVVNQLSDQLSQVKENQHWLDQNIPFVCYPEFIPISELRDKDGFLVNNEVKIVAEVEVLQVIGNSNVLVESQEVIQPGKKRKLEETSSVDVNGFKVLPSQAEAVKRIFEKHPNMTLNFRAKDQNLRTLCMNALLNLIETMCRSLQDLCIDDLSQADNTLTYLTNSGFKVDWLERKLEEVKETKIEKEIGETWMQELEDELKDIKSLLEKKKEEVKDLEKKCSNTEALLKKEKAKVLSIRVSPLTLDDVV